MTTCEPLPDGGEDGEPLTLFAVDSLASPSATRARGSLRLMSGGSGQPSRTSFASYDPGSSSWRTSRVSLDGEWETYSEIWPRAGMTRNGTAYRRQPSVPHISVTESGSWPTPKSQDAKHGAATAYELEHADKWAPYHLHVAIAARALWPTPKGSAANYGRPRENDRGDLQAAALMFPTPGVSNAYDNAYIIGQLNPAWVEWLMGYPEGWTDCGD